MSENISSFLGVAWSEPFKDLVDDPSSGQIPKLEVLYEDNHLLVVFKPHRTPIQSDSKGTPTLFMRACGYLKEKYQKPGNVFLGMVHRLDRPVSGVVVFGKTSKAASRLSEQIRERQMEKKYQAIVEGELKASAMLVHYLRTVEGQATEVAKQEGEGFKRAELSYKVIGKKHGFSFVDIQLETGRRHQIRAQLSAIGHPILGDGKYGAKSAFLPGSIALVSHSLKFKHPVKDEILSFELPLSKSSVGRLWHAL